MTHNEVQELFKQAVGILADEKGGVKERLLIAYASQLSSIHPQDDLPPSLSDDFRAIRYALSDEGMPYGYGEHAAKKLHHMSEGEASELAQRIFSIFLRLMDVAQTAAP